VLAAGSSVLGAEQAAVMTVAAAAMAISVRVDVLKMSPRQSSEAYRPRVADGPVTAERHRVTVGGERECIIPPFAPGCVF
jgi:hypothetical protein